MRLSVQAGVFPETLTVVTVDVVMMQPYKFQVEQRGEEGGYPSYIPNEHTHIYIYVLDTFSSGICCSNCFFS